MWARFDDIDGTGGHDTMLGGAGDDIIQGQRGDDTIDGGTGDDWIVGDDSHNPVPFNTEAPIVTRGIHLIQQNPSLNLNFGTYGTIVISNLTIAPQIVSDLLPSITLMQLINQATLPIVPLVGSLGGRDDTEFRPFASVIPDTVNHLSLLAGNDQIEGGAGQDTIIGDNYTSAVPLRSRIASLD